MIAYGTDLAYIHEAGFADLAEAAARHVRSVLTPRGRAVDLGCGGGTLLEALVGEGFEGVGIDASAAMIAMTRRRVPSAHTVLGSVYSVPIPRCRLVTAVGEVLNYVQDAHTHVEDVAALFARAHAALEPGGAFLFDVATTERPQGNTTSRRSGATWRVSATATRSGDRLTRTIDAWRTARGTTRHTQEVHEILLLDADWVLRTLGAQGFAAQRLGGYDDHGFQVGWDAFLATKPPQA